MVCVRGAMYEEIPEKSENECIFATYAIPLRWS